MQTVTQVTVFYWLFTRELLACYKEEFFFLAVVNCRQDTRQPNKLKDLVIEDE